MTAGADLMTVVFNEAELNKLLNTPSGAVGRHMRKIGLEIKAGAKALVGVRTGALKRAIYSKQGVRGRVQYVQVGADLPYARDHHEGTRPHRIGSDTGRIMRFNVGGKVVYARRVIHPGTRPRKYLTIPMSRAVR